MDFCFLQVCQLRQSRLIIGGVILTHKCFMLRPELAKSLENKERTMVDTSKSDAADMQMKVPLRKLGCTDLKISALGLGCWQFSGEVGMSGNYWKQAGMNFDDITAIIKIALDNGINWFDTAEFYGHGTSEKNLSSALQALGRQPGEQVIATKWWPILKFASNIHKTMDDRINCLAPYPIDLYMVHQPYSFSSIETQMNAMADQMDAGKIRSVGVSNFSAKAMDKAQTALQKRGYSLACNQMRYSLLFRNIESDGVLQAAKDMNVTIIAWSPLEQGMLTGKFHQQPELTKKLGIMRKHMFNYSNKRIFESQPLIDSLTDIGSRYDATPGQVALNWLVHHHGETVVAIPGATSIRQVEDNVGTLGFCLTGEELQQIDELSRQFGA
jgi:aryl-alcohol dehydrogenase-like predicted oxidoreductase